jgi:hypothetical protein
MFPAARADWHLDSRNLIDNRCSIRNSRPCACRMYDRRCTCSVSRSTSTRKFVEEGLARWQDFSLRAAEDKIGRLAVRPRPARWGLRRRDYSFEPIRSVYEGLVAKMRGDKRWSGPQSRLALRRPRIISNVTQNNINFGSPLRRRWVWTVTQRPETRGVDAVGEIARGQDRLWPAAALGFLRRVVDTLSI